MVLAETLFCLNYTGEVVTSFFNDCYSLIYLEVKDMVKRHYQAFLYLHIYKVVFLSYMLIKTTFFVSVDNN